MLYLTIIVLYFSSSATIKKSTQFYSEMEKKFPQKVVMERDILMIKLKDVYAEY